MQCYALGARADFAESIWEIEGARCASGPEALIALDVPTLSSYIIHQGRNGVVPFSSEARIGLHLEIYFERHKESMIHRGLSIIQAYLLRGVNVQRWQTLSCLGQPIRNRRRRFITVAKTGTSNKSKRVCSEAFKACKSSKHTCSIYTSSLDKSLGRIRSHGVV